MCVCDREGEGCVREGGVGVLQGIGVTKGCVREGGVGVSEGWGVTGWGVTGYGM